jgi:hypothetical protein
LVHIGVRSICAGVAALTIGFAAESVGRRVVGTPSAGQPTESALLSVFETIRPESLDHRASLVRVASLETGFSFKPSVEESEQSASTSRHASFGERFLFDQKLASFDERFAGGDTSQSRRTARTTYSTMHTCHRRVRGSTHLNLLPADPRRSLHRPLHHRPRAPPENGLRLRSHRSIRSHRPTMITAPRSMILRRVRSTCRTDADWKRIRALAATWTMLAMCT